MMKAMMYVPCRMKGDLLEAWNSRGWKRWCRREDGSCWTMCAIYWAGRDKVHGREIDRRDTVQILTVMTGTNGVHISEKDKYYEKRTTISNNLHISRRTSYITRTAGGLASAVPTIHFIRPDARWRAILSKKNLQTQGSNLGLGVTITQAKPPDQ